MGRARPWAGYPRAQARTLLAVAAGYDRLAQPVRWRTGRARPHVEEVQLGGVPATLFRPSRRRGPWPGVVVVPGATRRGRLHPAFVGVGRGLAAAGLLTAVVEPPGLAVGELTPETLAGARAAASAFVSRPDVRGARFAVAGVSGGGTMALLLAGSPGIAEQVSTVLTLAPCCDVAMALRLITTDRYRNGSEVEAFQTGAFFRLVLARSAIAWLEAGPDRQALREHVLGLEDDAREPLGTLRSWPTDGLADDARAILDLLGNVDPGAFDALYGLLTDGQRAAVDALSPIRVAASIRAPVELVVSRRDKYIPLADAVTFARQCSRARMTVLESLDHAVPLVSPAGARDLVRLDRVAVRFLAAACSPSYSGA